MFDVSHRVSIADAHGHLLGVTTSIRVRSGSGPLPSPLTLFMPVWTPGSYLVREYARQVEGFSASGDGVPIAHRKVRKNAWEISHPGARVVEVRYHLYANDLSVRTNHVDSTHAYWNGAATYLALESDPQAGARVSVELPANWEVATPLPEVASEAGQGRTFAAPSFDDLCDAPFECGRLFFRSFVALGKRHRLAVWHNADAGVVDWDALTADTQKIVETEADLMGGERTPEQALPYEQYLFIWHITPRGRGGLEHRSSTTLMAKPSSFHSRSGYLDVLSLVAHEFFHLWNVKRIRPSGLVPYRYEEENYTRMLWWFEGATSYYDWRILRVAKLCSSSEYLHHLAEEIARLEDTPGAAVHSLEEASFDAWIKAYRPDENSVNSTVSYYSKGEIVCALLDIELRKRTEQRVTLDDVMRRLYLGYGVREIPLPEGALADLFREYAGISLDDCFARWVTDTKPLEVNQVLAHAGLKFERAAKRDGPPASLGLRLKLEGPKIVVDAVLRGHAAHRAGIDARDEILAVAGRRVPEGRLELPLTGLHPGAEVPVLVARDGWVQTLDVVLDPPALPDAKIVPLSGAPSSARNLYQGWMGEPFPE